MISAIKQANDSNLSHAAKAAYGVYKNKKLSNEARDLEAQVDQCVNNHDVFGQNLAASKLDTNRAQQLLGLAGIAQHTMKVITPESQGIHAGVELIVQVLDTNAEIVQDQELTITHDNRARSCQSTAKALLVASMLVTASIGYGMSAVCTATGHPIEEGSDMAGFIKYAQMLSGIKSGLILAHQGYGYLKSYCTG